MKKLQISKKKYKIKGTLNKRDIKYLNVQKQLYISVQTYGTKDY